MWRVGCRTRHQKRVSTALRRGLGQAGRCEVAEEAAVPCEVPCTGWGLALALGDDRLC